MTEVYFDEIQPMENNAPTATTNSAINLASSEAGQSADGAQTSENDTSVRGAGTKTIVAGHGAVGLDALFRPSDGRPSAITEYCDRVLKQGGEKCLFICRRQSRRTFAQDIWPKDEENPVIRLQDQDPWWSRWSLYTVASVRHVKMKFTPPQKSQPPFEVFAMPVDHKGEIARNQRQLDRIVDELADEVGNYACGVDVDGKRHESLKDCEYQGLDSDLQPYCLIEDMARRSQQIQDLEWMPTRIEQCWQTGIGSEGWEFLGRNGFVLRYKELRYDRYCDAANPLGKTIHAFELVKGWQVRRLLWILLVAVVIAVGTVALCTLVFQNLQTGLAAGSYAVGIEALVLGGLTLLSVVLS